MKHRSVSSRVPAFALLSALLAAAMLSPSLGLAQEEQRARPASDVEAEDVELTPETTEAAERSTDEPPQQSPDSQEQERESAQPAPPAAGAAAAEPGTTGHVRTEPDTLKPVPGRRDCVELAKVPNGGPGSHWDGRCQDGLLGWDGNLELDVGYAADRYSTESFRPENNYDFRGRFVFGPLLHHDLGGGYFFEATGQVVAWVRDQFGQYIVNAEDVYGQAGKLGTFDFQIGRFETWAVYHKGLGFDLYTLDDTGAVKVPPRQNGQFGADIYEVNFIHYRDPFGKAAIHYFPLPILGFEAAGLYGNAAQFNQLGGRFAADLHLDFLRVSAAVEYRHRERSQEVQIEGEEGACDTCSVQNQSGFGGGAVLLLKPIELGLNAAKAHQTEYQENGSPAPGATYDRQSFGGYFQLDVGELAFQRSLILGVGANRTEVNYDNGDFERHTQGAAYIAYPLGFNNAMVKLVFSKADLLWEQDTGDAVIESNNTMDSVRLRLKYFF